MPTNEEGEFELVLGNKQLLSVFFIVVVLLGVFFTMGFIVGRNATPAPTQVASAGPESGPLVVEPPSAGGAKPSPVGDPNTAAPPPSQPPAETSAPPSKAAPPKAEPVKSEPAKAEPPKAAPSPPPVPQPTGLSGTYLQVAATKEAEADLLADALRKKGFPAAKQPVPDSILIRVLVGPLSDAAAVAKTKADLEAAGFKTFLRRI